MLARRARTSKSWDHVFNFRTCDVALSSLITYNRADASTCTTRRRAFGAVGPSRTNMISFSRRFDQWFTGGETGSTVDADVVVGRDGLSMADRYNQGSATMNFAWLPLWWAGNAALGGTFSIDLKVPSGTLSNVRISITDLTTVTATSSFMTLTTNWQRLTFTVAPDVLNNTGTIGVGIQLPGPGNVLHVDRAQFTQLQTDSPFIYTFDAPVTTTDWPRTNYIAKSNKFSSALWGRNATGTGVPPAIVSEVVPSPSGSLDATRITFNLGAGDTLGDISSLNLYQDFGLIPGANYCAGIWARIPVGVTLAARTVGGNYYLALVGTGQWKRYSRPEVADSTYAYLDICLRGGLGIGASTGRVTVDLWHCTLEPGSELTATIPNDTTAPLTVNTPPFGQMVTVPANVPVLEYDADGIGRGLRVEAAALNCVWGSQSPGDWTQYLTGSGAGFFSVLFDSEVGYFLRVKKTAGAVGDRVGFYQTVTDMAGSAYAAAMYVRMQAPAAGYAVYVDAAKSSGGVATVSSTLGSVPTDGKWHRVAVSTTLGGGATLTGSGVIYDWLQGEVGEVVDFALPQVECGKLHVTSPVVSPSGGNAARASTSALMVPSAVGLTPTSGTLLIDCEVGNTSSVLWQLGSAGDNTLHLARDGNTLRAWCNRAGVAQLANIVVGTPFTTSNRVRVAAAWSYGRIYVVVNGGEPNIFNASVPTSFADLSVGYYPYGGGYHIDGTVHELRTTSRTLTIAELVRETAL